MDKNKDSKDKKEKKDQWKMPGPTAGSAEGDADTVDKALRGKHGKGSDKH